MNAGFLSGVSVYTWQVRLSGITIRVHDKILLPVV
jgi:hypothetical protein